MRSFVIVFLFISLLAPLGVGVLAAEGELPRPPSPPQNPLNPENNAKAIKLESGSLLILTWELSLDTASEYRYQYWKLGDVIPEPGQKEQTVTQPKSIPILAKDISPAIRADLSPGAKYFWHVRSCADLDANGIIEVANECGGYSEPWAFTFLLLPPTVVAPTSGNTNLPVRFAWKEMAGAESYLIKGEIDFSDGLVVNILNRVVDHLPWFLSLGINFLLEKLGLDEQAAACPYALWDNTVGQEGCYSLPVSKNNNIVPSSYIDEDCLFTKNTKYTWQAAACLGENGSLCGTYSDKTSFKTNDTYNGTPGFIIPAPIPQAPFYDPERPEEVLTVGPQDQLSWIEQKCSHFYKVIIKKQGGSESIEAVGMGISIGLDLDHTSLKKVWDALNTVYTWQVKPCFMGKNQQDIKCESTTSSAWEFRTAGAPPVLQAPQDKTTVKIPVSLTWKRTEGAKTYKYEISKNSATKQDGSFQNKIKDGKEIKEQVQIPYEAGVIEPGALSGPSSPYWWHVKTCIDENGERCGPWSSALQFSTFPLLAPSIPEPKNNGQIVLTEPVRWNTTDAANAYQYHLEYACRNTKETLTNCVAYNTKACPDETQHAVVEQEKTVSSNSFNLPYCMGKYTWAVRSCLTNDCSGSAETRSGFSNNNVPWALLAVQPPPAGVGLVPCGKLSDEPATPYNEVEPCQLKHAGFLLQNLLDFILWKVSLFVLLLLAVITGATSYFSLGGPNALARIKTVFRSFFAGFLILVFAWMFVNIVLMLFGFQLQFFGKWWELSF